MTELERSHLRLRSLILNLPEFTEDQLIARLEGEPQVNLGPFRSIRSILQQFCESGLLAYENGKYKNLILS